MPDGQVVFEISGDNKKIKQALDDTTSAIEREGKKWDAAAAESTGGIENKFLGMFKKISAAAVAAKVGKTLLDWGKAAIQAASDLEEVQNVVDVTFGDGAAQIEKWAKAAGQQFGLTETQAKKFTSTLGAMMKSAGLAGPEIVDMSTDLAGLAADMASFYNLDFETAFQKIRSGISGETEPLKQLGINMSVANLEAFALTKGITKAFNAMTQGEQTMLRYQYLMQATADAQGDFARTSDGYANAVRTLETNIETLKTSIGNVIIPIVGDVVAGINSMIGALTQTAPRTVLDDFADIDLKTGEKLAQIQQTADEARAMIAVLEEIGGKQITSTSLTDFIGTLSGGITGLDSALSKAKKGDYAGTITALADALSKQLGGSPDEWETLLSAIGDALPDAVYAALDDKGQTAAFLAAAAAAADDLGDKYPALWKSMLGVLGDNAGAAITALANGATSAAVLGEMAKGFNSLSPLTSANKWESLLKALSENGNFDFTGKGTSVKELAKALNSNVPDVAKEAWGTLISVLSTDPESLKMLTGSEDIAGWLETMAGAADGLTSDDATAWDTLFSTLRGGLPNLTNATQWEKVLNALQKTGGVSFSNVTGGIAGLAQALESNDPGTDKAKAWQELLGALSADSETLSKLTGQDAEGAAAWLKEMSTAANNLDPASAEGWDALLARLMEGLHGLTESPEYSGLFEGLYGETNNAEAYLKALGYETDDIADAQAQWLEVCKRLVQTIPGLNEIINTETGEVKGGTDAISEYVEAWRTGQEKLAHWKAYYAKEEALNEVRAQEYVFDLERIAAEQRVKRLRDEFEKYGGFDYVDANMGINGNGDVFFRGKGDRKEIESLYNEYIMAVAEASKANQNYQEQVEANAAAVQNLQDMKDGLIAQYGEEEQAVTQTAESMTALEKAASGDAQAFDDLSAALTTATSALDEVSQYYDKVKQESESSIKSVVKGFDSIQTPAQKARSEMEDLTKQIDDLNAAGKDTSGLEKTFHSMEASIPTLQNMTAALDSQLNYLQKYNDYLAEARANGVSEDILATLADGSQESFDYLQVLAGAGADDIAKINDKWAKVAAARDELAESMTNTKLDADSEFQSLVDAAQAAAEGLNVYASAESAMESTVQGIADGIAAKLPSVQTQVDALNTILSGMDSNLGGYLGPRFRINGTHANGLDYVPFDDYLAKLHEGESILTAEEAKVWRDFKNGGASVANTIDYEAMGGVMRDNIKPGGNVYLDGRIVGSVLSAQQGNSLRALERSGWQQ